MAETGAGKTPAQLLLEAAEGVAKVRQATRDAAQALYTQQPAPAPPLQPAPPRRP